MVTPILELVSTMPRILNPPTVRPPGGAYSHGVLVGAPFKRLLISGQVPVRLDGTVPEGLEAQLAQSFDNLLAIIAAAQMVPDDIVKTTTYVTQPGAIAIYRKVRMDKLGAITPASTYLEIAGLASADWLCEIEAEVVREANVPASWKPA